LLLRERMNAELAAAVTRAEERAGGKVSAIQVEHARRLLADPATTLKEIAESAGVN
jgi:hypothetical protein